MTDGLTIASPDAATSGVLQFEDDIAKLEKKHEDRVHKLETQREDEEKRMKAQHDRELESIKENLQTSIRDEERKQEQRRKDMQDDE